MAITFTNDRYFRTDVGPKIFQNVPTASQWFKILVTSANQPAIPSQTEFLSKVIFDFWHMFMPCASGTTVLVRFACTNSAGSFAQVDLPLTIGVIYGIAITWDGVAGSQKVWVSGVPTQFGTFTGNTQNNSSALQIGSSEANTHVVYQLDDHNVWDNYLLTSGDVSSLLGGTDPTTIGTSATLRGRWTLSGTTGANPTIGDAGLRNAYGGGGSLASGGDGSDCISAGGSGTAVYAPPLVWAPTVTAHPYVATSGKVVAGTLASNIDGSLQIPSQLLVTPTLTVNGTNIGALTKPWFSGYHKCFFYSTPNSFQINPGDTVSLTAPAAWCNTAAGSVAALSGPIDNRAGKSAVGSDTNPRTLRMGVNHNLAPTSSGLGFYFPFKNYKYRMDAWPPFSHGKVSQNVTRLLANSGGNDSLGDGMNYPGAVGKWLFVWDAGNPSAPTIITGATADPTHTAVTQHPELSSNGVNGVGMCRVTDFQHVSPNGPAVIDVEVNFNDPSGTPNYSNLWIFAPGDWSIVNGAAVYDRSDPLALSATYTGRVTDNVGTLRWVDSSACGGNPVSYPYPELLNSASDETWGELSQRISRYSFTSVGPVNIATTPWIYSPLFRQAGQSFTATLTQNITTTPAVGTKEVYTFSDAATAPLMAGLEITIDSEIMRIIGVSGTSVTVNRGSNGTTPATHTAGTVTVNGRKPITSVLTSTGGVVNNITWQLTTATPHGITSGNGFNMIGWTGPAGSGGQLRWSDGTLLNPQSFVRTSWVTGPNTVVSTCGLFSDGRVAVLTATQALDPTTNYCQMSYFGGIPYEAIANASGRFPQASVHVNVPMDACDDMVYRIAQIFRDNFPTGRKVYVEYANEPWNWAFAAFGYLTSMGPVVMPGWPVMYQGQVNQLAYYVYRAAQVHTIFRNVFTAAGRGGEIIGLLNLQMANNAGLYLEFAAAKGFTVDAIAIAPYLDMEISALNSSVFNSYDDDQAIDMWTHELYYNTRTYPSWVNTTRQGITAYNTATGKNCVLMGYEGGAEIVSPKSDATVHWIERNHDMLYNPNWYVAEQDFYYWLQTQGFTALHVYSLSQYWNPEGWGMYHGLLQDHGRGDGSDGKADNRLFRANPASPNYKGANVCQDDRCVSVRGQAFIDWNAQVGVTSATSYTLTTPTPDSGPINVASGNFTVTPNSTYNSTITISPSGGGLSTPIVLSWSNSAAAQTFTITPTASGTVTLTLSNAGGLADPSPVTYTTTSATGYTFVGPSPSSGLVGIASGLFSLQPNGPYTGTITVTPSGGGLTAPIVLTWASSSTPQTFSVLPTLAGTVTLTPTNSGSLTDQSTLTYTATTPNPPPTARRQWLGPWFGSWFAASSSVNSINSNSTSAAGGVVQGGASAVSFHDVDAPRKRIMFIPWSRRSYRPRGR
jgi:hypothetical protein